MSVFDRLVALSDCLCEQITAAGLPGVCFCGILPGEVPHGDYVGDCNDCGMAWVRLTSAYPATQVGIADTSIGNCDKYTGFDVEVGILRCIDVGDEKGNPPPANVQREAAALQVLDMEVMLRAISCCPAISSKDYAIGQYEPIGPEGGIVGGTWTISVI